jgi:hypothetical protein
MLYRRYTPAVVLLIIKVLCNENEAVGRQGVATAKWSWPWVQLAQSVAVDVAGCWPLPLSWSWSCSCCIAGGGAIRTQLGSNIGTQEPVDEQTAVSAHNLSHWDGAAVRAVPSKR